MVNLIKIILESVKKTKNFEEKYDLKLPKDITDEEIDDLETSFSYLPKKFIKHHIENIIFKDLGAIHGRFVFERKKGDIIINPSIFSNKKYYTINDEKVPIKYLTIIHEIGHMIDHILGISDSKEWIELSGWKKVDKNEKTPDGYIRYIEKRSGRNIPGHKKSEWVHLKDSEFVRNYASKNPKEDFADTFAFVVLGKEFDFKGEGENKIKIIKNLLK